MPIYFKNGLNGLKYPKRKLILGSTLIKYWNFKLFVSPNKCLHKTHFKHSVKGGYVVFNFQYVDDNNLVDFGFLFLSLFFDILIKTTRILDFFSISNSNSKIQILFIFCLDLLAWIFPYVLFSLFFSLENPLSNDNSNNKNDKGCVDISRA